MKPSFQFLDDISKKNMLLSDATCRYRVFFSSELCAFSETFPKSFKYKLHLLTNTENASRFVCTVLEGCGFKKKDLSQVKTENDKEGRRHIPLKSIDKHCIATEKKISTSSRTIRNMFTKICGSYNFKDNKAVR